MNDGRKKVREERRKEEKKKINVSNLSTCTSGNRIICFLLIKHRTHRFNYFISYCAKSGDVSARGTSVSHNSELLYHM